MFIKGYILLLTLGMGMYFYQVLIPILFVLQEHWYERTKGLLMDFASGKLGQVNYHEPVPRGRTVSHTDLDPSEVEDYEYIRG